jgi:hypothetical protein
VALARAFSGSAFILDPPDGRLRDVASRTHRAIYIGRWALYAWIWSWLAFIPVFLIAELLIGDRNPLELPYTTWLVLLFVWMAGWLAAVHFRVSLKWPSLIVISGLIAFLPLFLLVVGAVGLGKLIISLVGRRNVLAASQLRADRLKIRPRGLLEALHDE